MFSSLRMETDASVTSNHRGCSAASEREKAYNDGLKDSDTYSLPDFLPIADGAAALLRRFVTAPP